MTGDPELPNENMELLARLDSWKEGTNPGPIIRWAAAHLRGCAAFSSPETTPAGVLPEDQRKVGLLVAAARQVLRSRDAIDKGSVGGASYRVAVGAIDALAAAMTNPPAGVLDEAALRTALDIDWTPFWRETPIEEPDGVHSFMADFDRDAFAAAIAREYAASQPTPGTGLRTAAERLLVTIRASHGPVRHYPCDICDRADALAAALGRSGSGVGRG